MKAKTSRIIKNYWATSAAVYSEIDERIDKIISKPCTYSARI